jgi:hypothetical protein
VCKSDTGTAPAPLLKNVWAHKKYQKKKKEKYFEVQGINRSDLPNSDGTGNG